MVGSGGAVVCADMGMLKATIARQQSSNLKDCMVESLNGRKDSGLLLGRHVVVVYLPDYHVFAVAFFVHHHVFTVADNLTFFVHVG